MQDFLKLLALSFITGLGYLSYHHPELTVKLLYVLFTICVLAHIWFKAYLWGWRDSHYFIENDDKIIENEMRNTRVHKNRILADTSNKTRDLKSKWYPVFYVAYAILISFFIFCKAFPYAAA